ncbi:MAG: DUF3857 domain-containing protein [Bacteroidales bacterium]|nr:DUF3857 domain-containing protein [Bacteroidales bacterium]
MINIKTDMLRTFVFIFLSSVILGSLSGQNLHYPVSEIPDSLKENAHAVIRYKTLEFELEDLDHTKITVRNVFTILDRGGDNFADIICAYNKGKKIKYITATIYNEKGNEIETFDRDDFKDKSMDPFGSVYLDTRLLTFSGKSSSYPYTIEINYEAIYDGSFFFPEWYPIDDYNLSVQYATFSVYVPKNYSLNIREGNLLLPGQKKEIDDRTMYLWEIDNYKAIDHEPFSPDLEKISPFVKLSPSVFKYGGYTGSMSDWNSFGYFIRDINDGRNDLPEEARLKVTEIISGKENDFEKAKAIYEYMQSNSRYVSIQIGIGGYQPFPASVVYENSYGDCKALTYYLKSMLEVAGIESFYSLIRAGKHNYDLDAEFTYSPFNHAILNVPIKGTDYWLECTSQIHPFGFIGDFTDDRYALVITENGGELKKTRKYTREDNKVVRKAEVNIKTDGMADATIKTIYTGLEYSALIGLINIDYDRQKDYLYEKHIHIPDFKINSFSYEDSPSVNPSVIENLDLELINYASVSGERIFVPLNLMNKFSYVPSRNKSRKNDIVIQDEFIHYDSIAYAIPEDYSIEFLPQGDTIDYDFGAMIYATSVNDSKVLYIRKFEFNRATYPKEKYDEFVSFCKEINKADKQKLILVKRQE